MFTGNWTLQAGTCKVPLEPLENLYCILNVLISVWSPHCPVPIIMVKKSPCPLENSPSPICVHWLQTSYHVPGRRLAPCSLCPPTKYVRSSLSLLLLSLERPHSLSHPFLAHPVFHSLRLTSLMTFAGPTQCASVTYVQGAQNWIQDLKRNLTTTEMDCFPGPDEYTSANASRLSIFVCASRMYMIHVQFISWGCSDIFLSSSFLSSQDPAYSIAWGYSLPDAGFYTLLNFMMLLSACSSHLSRFLQITVLPWSISSVPPNFVSSANMLKVSSLSSSKFLRVIGQYFPQYH